MQTSQGMHAVARFVAGRFLVYCAYNRRDQAETKGGKKEMATIKKTAAKKPAAKKPATPKVKAKTTLAAKKTADEKPAMKKGSKLSCQVCGFAVTVDRVCGCPEETHFVCCKTPMKVKRPAVKKK
jgi:hypothetical protein